MNQKLLISDANILIDMIVGGILEEIFSLDYEFAVPDVLFHEELRVQHPDLPEKGLSVLDLGEAAIIDTAQLNVKYVQSGVSNNDCMALALARQEDCPLLTGDAKLRQVTGQVNCRRTGRFQLQRMQKLEERSGWLESL